MKANGITCLDYVEGAGEVRLYLSCTAEEALAMDTTQVTIETDDGDVVETIVNVIPVSATVTAADGTCVLRCAVPDGAMAKAVGALIARVSAVEATSSDTMLAVAELGATVATQGEETAIALAELGTLVAPDVEGEGV